MIPRFYWITGILLILLWGLCCPQLPSAHAGPLITEINYTVQPGDTLSEIANTFDIDLSSLMRANNLKSSIIHPYQVLKIPVGVAEAHMSRGNISRDDLILLAKAIYAEARGESFEGQVAVGAVILNRVRSPYFPDTIREVILQRDQNICQFTPVSDGTINLTPDRKAIQAAFKALEGCDPTGGALFFYNPSISSDNWIKSLPVITRIGKHVFATKA